MVINHDFATARRIDFPQVSTIQNVEQPESVPSEDIEWLNSDSDIDENYSKANDIKVLETHSRTKRSIGSAFRLGLTLSSGAAFALSTGSTVYHAIQKCKDYRPKNCPQPVCNYHACPDTCHGPETNREYVDSERENLKKDLDGMDRTQRDAFNFATKAINSGLNNKRIFTEIDRINRKVDELTFSIAQLDIDLASKMRNQSVAIGGLIRNHRFSLQDIVSSPEVDGIFDKWTWEGTGVFVLSLALPLSLFAYTQMKQRYAIRQIYKNLKSDFHNRFVNQKTSGLNSKAKINNKFAHVQGLSTKQLKRQLKGTAKAMYLSDRANVQVSKVEKFVNSVVTPLINAVVTVLSAWSVYQQLKQCQLVANDMQNTAKQMAEKADEIQKLKKTQVDPLLANVTTKAWPRVRAMMTNETTLDWLDGIRNLTIGANNPNKTVAAVIKNFMDKIGRSSYDKFFELQKQLIVALRSVEYEYECLANKQNAITTVIIDCRTGRQPFPELYRYAAYKHKLNVQGCIAKGIFPYTTPGQFFKILNATAQHQGWYTNCLLNNNDLLYRVCTEKIKGYNTPAAIVKQLNRTGLTEDMVPNFLGRCPPPQITPKSIVDTCHLYCLYQPVSKIAKTVVLLERQVIKIQKTCPICSVKKTKLTKICKLHYCQGQNATTIEKEVELPLPTVESVIAKNCSGCQIDNPALKKTICENHKCRGRSATKLAKNYAISEAAVNGVLSECNVPDCLAVITDNEKSKILQMDCYFLPPTQISFIVGVAQQVVVQYLSIIKGKKCPPSEYGRKTSSG